MCVCVFLKNLVLPNDCENMKLLLAICSFGFSVMLSTHTHTHIYIYIYIMDEKENVKFGGVFVYLFVHSILSVLHLII